MAREGFGHLAAAGVADADEEDFQGLPHGERQSSHRRERFVICLRPVLVHALRHIEKSHRY